MMGELHHRFSNSLQLIVSATNGILRQGGCSQEACERLQALQTRISLLADVNRILCGPYGPGSITKQALERLCTDLAAAFERSDFSVWVTVAGKAAGPENCRYMLLLVGELVTNALKHAAHDRELLVGIDVILAADRCRLIVRSNTAAPVSVRPRIAEELVQAAGGELEVVVEGCEFRVTALLPGR